MHNRKRYKLWSEIMLPFGLVVWAAVSLLVTVSMSQVTVKAVNEKNFAWNDRGYEAYYLVLEHNKDGSLNLLSYTPVSLAAQLESLSTLTVQSKMQAPLRDYEPVAVTLNDEHGYTVFRTVVQIPIWQRGEFHPQANAVALGIDGHIFPLISSVFVVRVPNIEGTTLQIVGEDGNVKLAQDLDRLRFQAQSIVAPASAVTNTFSSTGSPANRADWLLIGEGYTSLEQTAFEEDVQLLLDRFFEITPYAEYRNYINVHTLFVASAESGADHPPYVDGCTLRSCCSDPAMQHDPLEGQFVETAFDGRFCDNGIQRLTNVDSFKVYEAAALMPDWDQIIVMINDPVYGGSGGDIMTVTDNELAAEIAQHEYGHSFAGLADEYTQAFPSYPNCSDITGPLCEANVTDVTNREDIKWEPWIRANTPIPTEPEWAIEFQNTVGLFEGARYQSTGMYRSGQLCIMRALGKPFCQVPAQTYVLKLYDGGWGVPWEGISLIEPDSISPDSGKITLWHPQNQVFSAVVLEPIINPQVVIDWYINDAPTGQTGNSFTFQTAEDQAGSVIELKIVARDETALVHPQMASPSQTSEHAWLVDVGYGPSSVSLTGEMTGVVNTSYQFTATTNLTATLPLQYSWSATEAAAHTVSDGLESTASYAWTIPGVKTVTVTVENDGGSAFTAQDIEIQQPVNSVTIEGPESGLPGQILVFQAHAGPPSATQPVNFTWQPDPLRGQNSAKAEYAWRDPGKKEIVVFADNLTDYTVSANHFVLVEDWRILLPLIRATD